MIAIMFGRAGSKGVHRKNVTPIDGRPCCSYPLRAANNSLRVGATFVSTDDPEIADIARGFGAVVIGRPSSLCTDVALLEDAIAHAWSVVGRAGPVCILQANAPCITSDAIDAAAILLMERPELDSVITACRMPGFAPHRARFLTAGGELVPAVDMPADLRCDRDSTRPAFFHDGGATVVRSTVLDRLREQQPPYRWQGARIGMVEQAANPGDIDAPWQIPAAEWWVSQHAPAHASVAA
jgi:N-acylneuraminate cytidylyltransferase